MKFIAWVFFTVTIMTFSQNATALDADCYDKGEDYFIPAQDLLEAKKKALLCFFAEISFKTSVKEGNQDVDFKQETNLEAKSSLIDWQGLRKAATPNLYRWPISDVNANLKALSKANEKKVIPVTKEMQEVWHSNQIRKDIIELISNPSGASVSIDGLESACQTPCKLEVIHGEHTVSLWKQDYSRLSGTIRVDGTRDSFPFELKENIGRIAFQNCPEGTGILIDGNRLGVTSNGQMKVAPGNYVLEFENQEYFKSNQVVSAKVGETVTVTCDMKAKIGGVEVSAKDSKGQPVKASVSIDGVLIGKSPGVFDVRAGSRRVRVFTEEDAWEDTVKVEKSAVTHVSAVLTPIESEAEKYRRDRLRSLSLIMNIGQMSDQRLLERKTGNYFEFKQCGSADPDKGSSIRLRLTKNLSDNFGLSVGLISADYETCHLSYDSNNYQEIIDKYKVSLQGPTAGIHYSLYSDPGTNGVYSRWFTLSVSAMKGLNAELKSQSTGTKWTGKTSHKVLGEISLIDMVVDHIRVSILDAAIVSDATFPDTSPAEVKDIKMLYIIGFGAVF